MPIQQSPEADGYYDEDGEDDEIDLSFLDN